jgi:Transglutaminase-like superfamily
VNESSIDVKSPYYQLIKPIPLSEKLAIAVEILTTYVHVRWLLWRNDLPTAVETLRGPSDHLERGDLRRQAIGVRLGKAVGRTLRFLPFDSRCLVRSLVLTRMLARRGIESKVVIGVGIEPEFSAHSWVESEGIELLPAFEDKHRRLVEL